MSYGQTLNSTLPAIGESGPGYATKINAFLEELQDIVEAKVTPSGITVNSDLSFSSGGANYLATELKATSFADQASPLSGGSYPLSLYFADGELYCNDGSGNQVQLTASGLLNAGAVGGITGSGYGADGKTLRWVDASNLYEFKDGSGTDDYADIIASGVRLADGSSNYVALAASSGMSGNYTLTFPAAAPGSTQIAQVASSGAVSYSNTIANAVTFSSAATFSTEYHHPERSIMLYGHDFNPGILGTKTVITQDEAARFTGIATARVPVMPGCRIKSIVLYLTTSASSGDRTFALYRKALTAAGTTAGTLQTDNTTAATSTTTTITLSSGFPYTVLDTNVHYLWVGDLQNDYINAVKIVYDHA